MNLIDNVLNSLLNGSVEYIRDTTVVSTIKALSARLCIKATWNEEDVEQADKLIHIGNIVYNNLDLDDDEQVIDNDIYDQLLVRYSKFNPVFQVGAEPIEFKDSAHSETVKVVDRKPLIKTVDEKKFSEMIYKEDILKQYPIPLTTPLIRELNGYESGRKYRDVSHGSPELVGTLDKCKYVLNSQVPDEKIFNDPGTSIFERDFFQKHRAMGILPDTIRLVCELKEDGISVEASIANGMVIRAASRGDTANDKATDLTPILYGYRFPFLPEEVKLDCKFEAVMTYDNLNKFNEITGKTYRNCRSAIVGIFSSNDGYLYQNFITLIPLKIAPFSMEESEELPRLTRVAEIEFMNQYLRKDVPLIYSYIEGDYNFALFQVKRFVDEAELVRDIMPNMYDGVVVSYDDEDLIGMLGRVNFVNKYSIAIKFNTIKKLTRFTGYTFEVGQDGNITPMIHYDAVSFLGTIHTKSSGASYARYKSLGLKQGDIIQVEYRNDVMPYVTKPEGIAENEDNLNPVWEFPTHCPSCGSPLTIMDSGKVARCENFYCTERVVGRVTAMLSRLGVVGISTETVRKLLPYVKRFKDIAESDRWFYDNREQIEDAIGPAASSSLITQISDIMNNPIEDYKVMSALCFSGIADEKWKKILSELPMSISELYLILDSGKGVYPNIKGIGEETWKTISKEFEYFKDDMDCIIRNMRLIFSYSSSVKKKIRFTGFRDKELAEELTKMGYDASDTGVTKDTYILLIPSVPGFTSTKMNKVGPDTKIVDIDSFRKDMSKFLQ